MAGKFYEESSDDEVPLASKSNGYSADRIPKSLDAEMDKSMNGKEMAPVGVSIRNGPVAEDKMDVDSYTNGKRKARTSTASKVSYNEDHSSDDSDVKPVAKKQKVASKKAAGSDNYDSENAPLARRQAKGGKLPVKIDESSDDEPLGAKVAKVKANIEKKAEKEAKAIRAKEKNFVKDESSDDDTPIAKKAKAKPAAKTPPIKRKAAKKEESDSDTKPLAKKKKATPATTPAKKGKAAANKDDDEDAEEEYAWWNAPKPEDDSIKWTTLQHNGVVFPPEYEPLPKNVKLKYDGTPVTLSVEAEEVAGFFGAMLHSTHNVENPIFCKNFFSDFQEVLKKTGGAKDKDGNKVSIKDFKKMDFQDIHNYYEAKSDARKARSPAEKKAEKAEKDKAEAPFIYCTWDGRKEKVGNFRVEPPGLFRGRGEHPKTGRVKARVLPNQITINIGKDAKVPEAPAGQKWKEVRHDNTATWLAMWQENINGAYKYVMLAANSSIKGQSDFKKFEKARELKKHIDMIRKDYTKELKSDLMADRQRATAVYLIDNFALRAGNEKDTENEAETVGCCSLKFEHVTLKPPNIVIFDFLGKDSIRFYDEVTVEPQVFKNLKIFKKAPKKNGDDIFDRLNTTQLNKHLNNYMPGLSAKVFRTYNASFTMSTLLKDLKASDATIPEKIKLYNDCNRQVAILCNHKRTVGASHEAQMEKMGDRIKGLEYQKWRTKQMILDLDPKMKKKQDEGWFELPEDIDQEWVEAHQAHLVEELRQKITKKFEKENEKLVAEDAKPMKDNELKERLTAATDLEKKFKKENKTKKVEAEGRSATVEKYMTAIEKIDARIGTLELQAQDRDENKEVALGTSKINYIDPRLTVVFSKRFNVPIEKFFSKTLREKFNWAIKSVEDEDNWEF